MMAPSQAEGLDAGTTRAGRLAGLVASTRPRQWIKNLACFAGLIFSGLLVDAAAVGAATWAFAGFCLASSSVYLINDVCDRRADAANPKKRSRPIASGRVPVAWALMAAAALAAAAVGSSLLLTPGCVAVLATYLAMSLAYSIRLKHTVLLDVMIIAVGFVLRILYGAFAISVPATPWIVLCMFFLALFLGFAKRRSELVRFEVGDPVHRPVLVKYRTGLLDLLLAMTATMAITCYALYTVLGRPDRPGHETLVLTVPVVVYGVYRYLLIVLVFDVGDAPERDVVDDLPLIVAVAVWIALCILILYLNINFIHLIAPAPPRGGSGS
jgi:4-hydroxybenzoate polyprenyltransferase